VSIARENGATPESLIMASRILAWDKRNWPILRMNPFDSFHSSKSIIPFVIVASSEQRHYDDDFLEIVGIEGIVGIDRGSRWCNARGLMTEWEHPVSSPRRRPILRTNPFDSFQSFKSITPFVIVASAEPDDAGRDARRRVNRFAMTPSDPRASLGARARARRPRS